MDRETNWPQAAVYIFETNWPQAAVYIFESVAVAAIFWFLCGCPWPK